MCIRDRLSFIPILVKQRGLIANIVLATLLVTLINIVGSYYLQSIIDTYVPDQMRSTLGIIDVYKRQGLHTKTGEDDSNPADGSENNGFSAGFDHN